MTMIKHRHSHGLLVGPTINNGTQDGIKNIGDYIQSIAGETFFEKIDVYVDRERLSVFKSDSEKVKMIMNAWYMWFPEYWPPSEDIIPLLVSMHIAPHIAEKMLSPKGIDYLRRYGPVGCRDRETEHLLRNKSIPCYFSGCLTLTLGERYKSERGNGKIIFTDPYFEYFRDEKLKFSLSNVIKAVCYRIRYFSKTRRIDKSFSCLIQGRFRWIKLFMALGAFYKTYSTLFEDDILLNAEFKTHLVPEGYKTALDTEDRKLEYARKLVKEYAECALVVTSRIHCALPCLGLETPVLFVTSGMIESKEKHLLSSAGRLGGLMDLFRVIRCKNFALKKEDDTLPEKIGMTTRITNKRDWIALKNELVRRCREFADDDIATVTPPPPPPPPPPPHCQRQCRLRLGSLLAREAA